MNRPLLFLDVDGPLNPYAAQPERRPAYYVTLRVPLNNGMPSGDGGLSSRRRPLRVWLNPGHGPTSAATRLRPVLGHHMDGRSEPVDRPDARPSRTPLRGLRRRPVPGTPRRSPLEDGPLGGLRHAAALSPGSTTNRATRTTRTWPRTTKAPRFSTTSTQDWVCARTTSAPSPTSPSARTAQPSRTGPVASAGRGTSVGHVNSSVYVGNAGKDAALDRGWLLGHFKDAA